MVESYIRIVNRLSLVTGILAAAMIAVSVVLVCEMIFVRYVLGHSTIWQTELVTYLMIGATLIGMPYVQQLRGHVNVDLVPHYLGRRARLALSIVVLVLSLAVAVVFALYGYDFWYEAWEGGWRSETVWGARLWVPYAALPIGFALFALQLLADLLEVTTGRSQPFGLPDTQQPGSQA